MRYYSLVISGKLLRQRGRGQTRQPTVFGWSLFH